MGRVREAISNVRRHMRPDYIIGYTLVVVVAGIAGLTERGAWPCLVLAALGGLGLTLNLTVILLNGGYMPARMPTVPPELEERYRPIDGQTRGRLLGDWIPVGPLLLSPGDLCLLAAMAMPFLIVAGRLAVGPSG